MTLGENPLSAVLFSLNLGDLTCVMRYGSASERIVGFIVLEWFTSFSSAEMTDRLACSPAHGIHRLNADDPISAISFTGVAHLGIGISSALTVPTII
jgi:hypothetical protein